MVLVALIARPAEARRPRPVAPVPEAMRQAPPPAPEIGLGSVIGRDARQVAALLGAPDVDAREGPARKLQYVGGACILDAYLYSPADAAEPVVTHVDARLPDGGDADRNACLAAFNRRSGGR